eukprot:2293862-Rhodomonas_salina.1
MRHLTHTHTPHASPHTHTTPHQTHTRTCVTTHAPTGSAETRGTTDMHASIPWPSGQNAFAAG